MSVLKTPDAGLLSQTRGCLVNRNVRITSLAAKDRCGGFDWSRLPELSELGKHAVKGGFEVRELVNVRDVDGRVKKVLKTSYLDGDGAVRKKPAYGFYQGDGWRFHGGDSRNWKPGVLSPEEIIAELNAGWSITPGRFLIEPGKSRRSVNSLQAVSFLLMDGDEWSEGCPPPASIAELRDRFPALADDFYWIGESISSRSELKPEMRFRLLALFPMPIARDAEGEGEGKAWFLSLITGLLARYPFLARGPSTDMVRLAYGNGRQDVKQEVLGGCLSADFLSERREHARAFLKREREKTAHRGAQKSARAERRRLGGGENMLSSAADPLDTFLKETARRVLEQNDCSFLGMSGEREEWNFHQSGPGRSFVVVVSGDGTHIILPYSNSMKAASPETDMERGVPVHRWAIWYRYGIDIKKGNPADMDRLARALAADGYGVYRAREKPSAREKKTLPPPSGVEWLSEDDPLLQGAPKPRKRNRASLWKRTGAVSPIRAVATTLSKLRAAMTSDLRAWLRAGGDGKRFFLLRQDTGVGKSTAVIAETDGLIHVSATSGLADEAFAAAVAMEKQAFRWRARSSGFEAALADADVKPEDGLSSDARGRLVNAAFADRGDGESVAMCGFFDIAHQLVGKGYSLPRALCQRCRAQERCWEVGYLSQFKNARESAQVFIALPDLQLASDPGFKSWGEGLDARGWQTDVGDVDDEGQHVISPPRTVILDDISADRLCPRRAVSLSGVERLLEKRTEVWVKNLVNARGPRWRRFKADAQSPEFLSELADILKSEGLEGRKARYVRGLVNESPMSAVREELSKIPVYFVVNGEQVEEAITGDVFPAAALPDFIKKRSEAGVHRLFLSPEQVFELGLRNPENAPAVVDFENGWVSALMDEQNAVRVFKSDTGEPTLEIVMAANLNFKNTIALSATDTLDDFRRVLPAETDVQVSGDGDGARPAWKDDCRVFQLDTGFFTNSSWFVRRGDGQLLPGDRLPWAVDLICRQARKEKVLVVGRAALTAGELADVTAPLFSHERIDFRNYKEIIGKNEWRAFETAFLFLPWPSPEEVESRCAGLYRADFAELDLDKLDKQVRAIGTGWEVSVPNAPADARVWREVQKMMNDALYQAGMRLRPNLSGGKAIVILSAFPVEGFSDRADLMRFDFEDTEGIEDIRDVNPRRIEHYPQSMPTAEVAARSGASERQVWRARGGVDKTARDAQVRALAAAGLSQRRIATETGVPRTTVARLLKKPQ